MGKVVNFISALINKSEENITLRLDSIEFSRKHGHEICIMQLVGKNAFPKMTTHEILSNPRAMVGISPADIVSIVRLDEQIRERKSKNKILEIDSNGSIVLINEDGSERRYSEKYISSDRELLNTLDGSDAHDIGYRVGFKDGLSINEKKKNALNSLKRHLISLF